MIEREPSLQQAELRASAARRELRAAAGDAFAWLTPNRLKAEAAMAAAEQIDEAKAALRRSVTRHPLATWSAFTLITAVTVYALRRPALALTRTGIDAIRALRQRIARRTKKL
ncbi:MAG TPA: hypothetical protein VF463_00285 [Sphingobium sp.]